MCRNERPNCVLLDYRLPDRDGVSCLSSFLAEHVGVVVLTGVGDESVAVACLKGGAHDYLSKNELTRENLLRALRNASEKARLVREVTLHHQIVSAMPIGVAVFQWKNRSDLRTMGLLWRNQAAARAAHIDDDSLGTTPLEARSEFLETVVPRLIASTISTGESQALDAVIHDSVFAVRTVPLEGDLAAILFEDVTEERRAVDERKRMEAQMRAAQRLEAVGRLAGGVAHDFNNILSVIHTHARFVRDAVDSPAIVADVDTILDASDRAAKLTAQLLAFGRRQMQSLKVVSMNDIVEDVQRMLGRIIGEDIELIVHLSEVPPVKVDPTHMEQVLVNLAVNARDAMPGGGKLTIETSRAKLDDSYGELHGVHVAPGDYVMLSVTDTGQGMDEETRQRIFEPFFTTKGSEGTGLGLSTVFGIVKQSGGFIWVYSELGLGTTFKVHLPASEETQTSVVAPRPQARKLTGTETVLVVEDEEKVRKAICRVLGNAGYTVLEAADAEQAMRLVDAPDQIVDMVLTDIVMPDLAGPDLADCIASRRPETQVLYMSGYTGHTMVHRTRLQEGARFVQKPFSSEALLAKVREVLDDIDEGGA